MRATKTTKTTLPARWRSEFLSQLSKMPSPEFVLSTLHPAPAGFQVNFVPRVRTCVYRGMWAELQVHRNNPAETNEEVYHSDLLTFTTDVRMNKVHEIFSTSSETGQLNLSGGNGPVEAMFWIKEAKTQWRFRGQAFVLGNDIDDETSIGASLVKKAIGERMRLVNAESRDRWSWSKELTANFGNLSPQMRGTFKNPTPGSPISIPKEDRQNLLGQEVHDVHDKVARENFRLVIIKPYEVERFYLGDISNAERRVYKHVGPENDEEDEWKEEEIWP